MTTWASGMDYDAIITWASGDEFCRLPEFKVFLNSIKKLGMAIDTIIFTHDMPDDVREQLLNDGFMIVDIDPAEVHMVVRDRFLAVYRWLAKQGNIKRVLLTDSKDVLFQNNPFIPECKIPYVLLCSEGGEHYQSEWNCHNQIKYQMNKKPFETKYSRQPIINSGFILGTTEEIKNLCLLIWSNSLGTVCPLSEQATLNYLYPFLIEDPVYTLVDPETSVMCVTGEGIKREWLSEPPYFEDGKLYHGRLKSPYHAVHQWERTCHKDAILEVYS